MTRLSPTSEEHFALQALSSGAWQASRYGTGQVLWDQENTLRCHAKSSVATAGVVTVKNLRVTLFPRWGTTAPAREEAQAPRVSSR